MKLFAGWLTDWLLAPASTGAHGTRRNFFQCGDQKSWHAFSTARTSNSDRRNPRAASVEAHLLVGLSY